MKARCCDGGVAPPSHVACNVAHQSATPPYLFALVRPPQVSDARICRLRCGSFVAAPSHAPSLLSPHGPGNRRGRFWFDSWESNRVLGRTEAIRGVPLFATVRPRQGLGACTGIMRSGIFASASAAWRYGSAARRVPTQPALPRYPAPALGPRRSCCKHDCDLSKALGADHPSKLRGTVGCAGSPGGLADGPHRTERA